MYTSICFSIVTDLNFLLFDCLIGTVYFLEILIKLLDKDLARFKRSDFDLGLIRLSV